MAASIRPSTTTLEERWILVPRGFQGMKLETRECTHTLVLFELLGHFDIWAFLFRYIHPLPVDLTAIEKNGSPLSLSLSLFPPLSLPTLLPLAEIYQAWNLLSCPCLSLSLSLSFSFLLLTSLSWLLNLASKSGRPTDWVRRLLSLLPKFLLLCRRERCAWRTPHILLLRRGKGMHFRLPTLWRERISLFFCVSSAHIRKCFFGTRREKLTLGPDLVLSSGLCNVNRDVCAIRQRKERE